MSLNFQRHCYSLISKCHLMTIYLKIQIPLRGKTHCPGSPTCLDSTSRQTLSNLCSKTTFMEPSDCLLLITFLLPPRSRERGLRRSQWRSLSRFCCTQWGLCTTSCVYNNEIVWARRWIKSLIQWKPVSRFKEKKPDHFIKLPKEEISFFSMFSHTSRIADKIS